MTRRKRPKIRPAYLEAVADGILLECSIRPRGPYVDDVFVVEPQGKERAIGTITRVTAPKAWRVDHAESGARVANSAHSRDNALAMLRYFDHLW